MHLQPDRGGGVDQKELKIVGEKSLKNPKRAVGKVRKKMFPDALDCTRFYA